MDNNDFAQEGLAAKIATFFFLSYRKGSDRADLAPASLANKLCPQLVIKYYEERLSWAESPNDDKNIKTEIKSEATSEIN